MLTVACGDFHSQVVTKDGALWTFGSGDDGALGHNDYNTRLVPARIKVQHFGNTNIVSVASGHFLSAAVTEEGTLYTWGEASGLGHANAKAKLVPTRIAPSLLQGTRVEPCHDLPSMHVLAFTIGTHSRLGSCAAPMAVAAGGSSQRRSQRQQGKALAAADKGKDCEYVTMPGELVQRVVEACVSWPEGRAGELEGLVRLLGDGMMKARGAT